MLAIQTYEGKEPEADAASPGSSLSRINQSPPAYTLSDMPIPHYYEDESMPKVRHPIEQELTKMALARHACGVIKRRRLRTASAARATGLDGSKISALLHGRLAGFSVHRLMRSLAALGQDVAIVINTR